MYAVKRCTKLLFSEINGIARYAVLLSEF